MATHYQVHSPCSSSAWRRWRDCTPLNPRDAQSQIGRPAGEPAEDIAEPVRVQIDAAVRDAEDDDDGKPRPEPAPATREIRGPEKENDGAEKHDRAGHVPTRESILGALGARAVRNPLPEAFDQDGAGGEDRNPERPSVAAQQEEPEQRKVERDHDVP